MRNSIPVFIALLLLASCSGENAPQETTAAARDTVPAAVPQFDISGKYTVRLNDELISDTATSDFFSLRDAKETDTLYIRYAAAEPCAECRLETQIWMDAKYKDVVRDTGYGMEKWTAIPLARLRYDATALKQQIALYLSVRQYHPVETGNKRFLFNLEVEFAQE
jgi:hypothetical protein